MDKPERQHSPAAERNAEPILQQLQRLLPASGRMLEVASGTGQHAAHFASHLSGWQWQPSDPVEVSRASVDEWCKAVPNVARAIELDVLSHPWPMPAAHFDAVFCANMLHISPRATCEGLMRGSRAALKPGGLLVLYGPYLEATVATAPGNLAFDADLRQRNPEWGLRDLAAVLAVAAQHDLHLRERVAMPANNLLLVLACAPHAKPA